MYLVLAIIKVLGAFILFLASIYFLFLIPPKYPRHIPAVPFWVVLIPFFKDVDQSETFKKYIQAPIRTHGVIKIFFGAQWNILVHRPAYLAEMFRREDLFQKSGNQKKIPHSVLAAFLGDNIISSHGDIWKTYQGVVRPGLQRNFATEPLTRNASRLCDLISNASKPSGPRGIPVQQILQRYTVANVAESLLQTDFHSLDSADATINVLQSSIKQEIFKPVFMNFPFLDRLPIPSRNRARELAFNFTDALVQYLTASYEGHDCSLTSDKLGERLLAAWRNGKFTEQQFRDNLTVTFVAGQENPQLLLISTLYLLGKHPKTLSRLYTEICSTGTESPTHDVLQELPWLTAVIYESLRLFPPIGQLINRRAAESIRLDEDIVIPKGTYLGYNCYSTNRDPAAWGQDADQFCPERWGLSVDEIQRLYRQKRARAEFISFHGGKRACLGERFAMLEARVTLFVLVKTFSWTLDPAWPEKMTPAGPLYPRALKLIFNRR